MYDTPIQSPEDFDQLDLYELAEKLRLEALLIRQYGIEMRADNIYIVLEYPVTLRIMMAARGWALNVHDQTDPVERIALQQMPALDYRYGILIEHARSGTLGMRSILDLGVHELSTDNNEWAGAIIRTRDTANVMHDYALARGGAPGVLN